MMAFNPQNIPKVDHDRQCSVYGYIHQYEKSNQLIIPKGIILVLILFYGNDTDEWDPKYIGVYMKLSGKTLTQESDGRVSSYGTRIIESGIFKWRLKVNECVSSVTTGFMLGCRRVKSRDDAPPQWNGLLLEDMTVDMHFGHLTHV